MDPEDQIDDRQEEDNPRDQEPEPEPLEMTAATYVYVTGATGATGAPPQPAPAAPVPAAAAPVPAPVEDGDETGGARYLISPLNVDRETLRRLSIRVTDEAMSIPCPPYEPFVGFAVTRAGVTKLGKAGYLIKSDLFSQTPYDGVIFVPVLNPDGTPARPGFDPNSIKLVRFQNWGGAGDTSTKEAIKALVVKILVPVIGKHIDLMTPRTNPTPAVPVDGNTFQICFAGSPELGQFIAPETIFSRGVQDRHNTQAGMWTNGYAIQCPEGYEIGAWDKGNLFLYWRAAHTGRTGDLAILEEVFKYVAQRYNNEVPVPVEEIQARYVQACSARWRQVEAELVEENQQLEEQVRGYTQSIADSLRRSRLIQAQLKGLAGDGAAAQELLIQEFKTILAFPKVTGVDWRGNRFVVNTQPLFCTDPRTGKVHDIGAFKFVIDSQLGELLFFNQTRRVVAFRGEPMHAPHVFQTGRACLGNLQNNLPTMIGRYQWAGVIQIALAFIESVNVDDGAGALINCWPEKAATPVPSVPAAAAPASPRTNTVPAETPF